MSTVPQTISRFPSLFDPNATADATPWSDLFARFATKRPFLGDNKHPGWSPAEFDPPQRSIENVQRIFALVLDYDNKEKGVRVPNPVTLNQLAERFADYFAFIHTTRSHTAEWPRFRVIVPFKRPVSKTEYQGVWETAARRWPGLDPAPKDPSRFWYEPGVGDGAEFATALLTGAFLDPDEMLAEPVAIVETKPEATDSALQVKRARAYIQKMPESISGEAGHTCLFSVACKLVHGFELDDKTALWLLQTEYNPRCRPPWDDKDLRRKIKDARTKARNRKPVVDRPPESASLAAPAGTTALNLNGEAWKKHLRYNADSKLTKDVGNATIILKNAPGLAGCLRHNVMTGRSFWYMEPTFDIGIDAPEAGSGLEDHHPVYVQQVLAKVFGLSIGKDIAWSAIEAAAHEVEIHPIQDYLTSLEWDEKPRLKNWLHTYLGADDTPYNAAVGRWWLISAVARAMQPGCKVDHVMILEGNQGKGKSQAMGVLGDPWTLGTLPDIRDATRAADTIAGYWIVEIAELDAFKGAGMTKVKDFVTQKNDVYRKAYGRDTLPRPRSCVFVGTTNESTYLSDPTGARRFWPVKTDEINLEALKQDRDQLWAEAVSAFRAGERWYPDASLAEAILEEQKDRQVELQWGDEISAWVVKNNITWTTASEVLTSVIKKDLDKRTKTDSADVATCLKALGFKRGKVKDVRGWVKDQ